MATNTSYLSASIETGRINSAVEQMTAPPEKPRLFDLTPRYLVFESVINEPSHLQEIEKASEATIQGFACVRTVQLVKESGVGKYYRITAAPWSSWDEVADELDMLVSPF